MTMTIRILKALTADKSLDMRYGKLANKLTATKRSPAVKDFRFFETANVNRRIFSRIA